MLPPSTLTTARVLDVFAEEVAARGGAIRDTFHDGQRLFARSVLPTAEEVRPSDRVQGGVALKATGDGVWVYPYVFRQVCRNGAIMAQALAARSLGDLHELDPETALECVREGVAACCAAEVFQDTVLKMRTASETNLDRALTFLPLLSRFSTPANAGLLSAIIDRFFGEGDRSQFGLANAVTSVARDARDPDLRWNLEELGGGVAVGVVPRHPFDGKPAAKARSGRAAAVA